MTWLFWKKLISSLHCCLKRKDIQNKTFKLGKLQWERDIPQDALDNLQNLANTDFHNNLGKIVHDIYLTAHNLFNDMPQGNIIK